MPIQRFSLEICKYFYSLIVSVTEYRKLKYIFDSSVAIISNSLKRIVRSSIVFKIVKPRLINFKTQSLFSTKTVYFENLKLFKRSKTSLHSLNILFNV